MRLPIRIQEPISWRGKPGWLGLYTIYEVLFTDGKYRRVSKSTIEYFTAGD